MTSPQVKALDERLRRVEERFHESAEELKDIRRRLLNGTRREIHEIEDEWQGVHYRWWVITLAGVLGLFILSYLIYTQLGWYADHRPLPTGSDWLLRRLPPVNVLPMLSWGWFALHIFAGAAAVLYYPRRMPFLIFMLSVYLLVRTAFVFLSPIGPPAGMLDMRQLDYIFSRLLGTYTFNNEFVFSGHTSTPFLFYLFFETKGLKRVMMAGSLTMAVCVLLSHNHYTVDVLSAYLVSYAVYKLSERLYYGWVRPLFMTGPSPIPY